MIEGEKSYVLLANYWDPGYDANSGGWDDIDASIYISLMLRLTKFIN